MEAWSYVPENKGFVSDDSIGREKSGLLGWELKSPPIFGNNFEITNVEGIQNQFAEVGFNETIRKSWDVSSSVTIANSNTEVVGRTAYTPITSSAVSVYSVDEPTSRFSSSVVAESDDRDLSLIDLKLGRLSDHRDTWNFKSSKLAHVRSSVESSPTPSKRARANLSSQGAFCQVHGCRKDLSSCKDYHKRHKVCEIHSKTAKVIVNGIEQRFCQQCSRFHLLGEFDDGKRSCRKRLAGHNERRRKPQAGTHAGPTGRLFHSYFGSLGSRPQGITLAASSVISQDPTNLMYPFRYNSNDWNRHKKHQEAGTLCHPQSEITITNGYHSPKSIFSHDLAKNVPPFHVNEVSSASGGGDISKTNNQNIHENFILFNSASAVQGLPGISASGRALSLLSSQSRNYPNHSPEILIPQSSINGLSNKFRSPTDLFSLEEGNSNLGPILISEGNGSINYGDGIFQGSECVDNSKGRGYCDEGAATIDLLQLSSQLQRVEHERQYIKLKQDDDAIRGLKIP